MVNEPGICPSCGSDALQYGVMEPEERSVMYPYVCVACGHAGAELYELNFLFHIDENGSEFVKGESEG